MGIARVLISHFSIRDYQVHWGNVYHLPSHAFVTIRTHVQKSVMDFFLLVGAFATRVLDQMIMNLGKHRKDASFDAVLTFL